MSNTTVEIIDRDPKSISQHLQTTFEDVIGEPEGLQSPEFAWNLSRQIFDLSKNSCYILLSVLCAPLTACCWGCTFACQAFEQIWCTNPSLRFFKIAYRSLKMVITISVDAIIVPIADGCSRCCSRGRRDEIDIEKFPNIKYNVLTKETNTS